MIRLKVKVGLWIEFGLGLVLGLGLATIADFVVD